MKEAARPFEIYPYIDRVWAALALKVHPHTIDNLGSTHHESSSSLYLKLE